MQYSSWRARLASLLLCALTLLCAALPISALAADVIELQASDYPVERGGDYSSMEEVAVYLATYGELPQNYLTKKEADKLGWKTKGDLDEIAPGYSIGGDRFGNYEGQLPDKRGRSWTECDIDYKHGSRNAKRLIFSNDGLMYYTHDHYESFTQVVVSEDGAKETDRPSSGSVDANGWYTDAQDVALYLHTYGELPPNYLTKSEAKELGWTNKKNNLGAVAPGCAIGGDSFGNREGLLPDKKNRKWYECDVNVVDGKRGDERIVYSSDGLIYFTNDNHKSFTQLY